MISSPVAGRVAQVAVEEGDHVAAGALLAVIEDPSLPAGSVEAHAGVASAQAHEARRRSGARASARLVDSGIGARRDLDDARAKAAAAAAELDAAMRAISLASQQLARRELRAPHAGVVLHVWKRVGESVDGTTATPVAEVADLTRARAPRAGARRQRLCKLHDGLAATVQRARQSTPVAAHGRARRAGGRSDDAARQRARSRSTRAKTTPPVGSAATARIVIAQRQGVVVPADRAAAIGDRHRRDRRVRQAASRGCATVTIGVRGDTASRSRRGSRPASRSSSITCSGSTTASRSAPQAAAEADEKAVTRR